MLVKYTGQKEVHVDTLFGTGLAWEGHGDVLEVRDEDAAARMVQYAPKTYEKVDELDGVPGALVPGVDEDTAGPLDEHHVQLPDGRVVRLVDAPRKQLAQYAREELGLAVQDGHGREAILTAIANVAEARARIAARAPRSSPPPPAEPAAEPDAKPVSDTQNPQGLGLAGALPALDDNPLAGFDAELAG